MWLWATTMTAAAQEVAAGDRTKDPLIQRQMSFTTRPSWFPLPSISCFIVKTGTVYWEDSAETIEMNLNCFLFFLLMYKSKQYIWIILHLKHNAQLNSSSLFYNFIIMPCYHIHIVCTMKLLNRATHIDHVTPKLSKGSKLYWSLFRV